MPAVEWSPAALQARTPQPQRLLAGIFLAWAAVALILTLNHEPWRDEADSWLVARDLPLSEAVAWTRNAGTPMLWYVLLMPLARAGLPYAAQSILHLLIAAGAAAVFLFRAPFTVTTKTLFLFSFYPLCVYTVIARTYSLGILLTFGIVALHRRRETHPIVYAMLVVLLSNTNVHCAGIAAAATLMFAIDLPRQRLALSIMIGGMALAVAQLYTPGHLMPPVLVSGPWAGAFPHAAARAFLPAFDGAWTTLWALILLGVVFIAIRKNRGAVALFAVSHGALATIFTFFWIAGFRHNGLVLIATVAAIWLGADAAERSRLGPAAALMLNLSLALSIPMAIHFAREDFSKNYSGAGEMATYILRQGLAHADIAAHAPAQAEAVLAHLPRRTFWYAALGEDGSYMKWDRAYRVAMSIPVDRALSAAAARYRGRNWLFLSSAAIPRPERFGLELQYATRGALMEPRDEAPVPNDERYWLYRSR